MSSKYGDRRWTTENEIEYLDHIGEYLVKASVRNPKIIMWRNYIQAAQYRTDWGQMDAAKIMQHVNGLIYNCVK